ncbi:MAG: toprim domain-containing protein, partial [Candidatus Omnitrophota bacterium]
MQNFIINDSVEKYHKALPERIRAYLNQRCILNEIIDKFKIGWNGNAITIPIYDRNGEFLFFKYRKDPEDESDKAKYWYDSGTSTELYGWENIDEQFVVFCEGELDRLALESKGIPAITGTSGVGTFKEEWVKYLENIPNLYVCYDKDDIKEGMKNTKKFLEKLPLSKYISLAFLGDGKKDITDFFMLDKTKEDFLKLVRKAQSLDDLKFLDYLSFSEESFLHPSQDFINNRGYFTIPMTEYKDNKRKQIYYMVTSERKLLRLENEEEFYKKYKFHINHLPAIQNQKTRWLNNLIVEFIRDEYTVNPKNIFNNIKNIYQKYSEMKEEGWYDILPLFVIGSYFYIIFETFPYIAFEGIKNTGKSKTARITIRMSFNGMLTTGLSDANLFRIIEDLRCALGIDEAEELRDKEKNQSLRAILNAGYSKGAEVLRQEKTNKGTFESRYFNVYSPKVIANTRGLEDTLESRTVKVVMLRAKGERGTILDSESSDNWPEIRHSCYCFALTYFKEIRE